MKMFTVGIGKAEITPPLSVPYLGFSPRHSFFAGVHDPLLVRSLYVSDGTRDAVIVSADAIGFASTLRGSGDFTEEIRVAVSRSAGVPSERVMLAATHAHSTPDTLDFRPLRKHRGVPVWLDALKNRIACSAGLARENVFPAVLKSGQGRAAGISLNRRREKCLDQAVRLLCFESESRQRIFLVHFACHATIVQAQRLISADFPGVVTSRIERTVAGARGCLFLQGACGDVNPTRNSTGNFDDVISTGLVLTGEALKIIGRLSLSRGGGHPVIVRAASRKCRFRSRPLPAAGKCRRTEAEARERIKEGSGPFRGEIQLLRVGNVLLTGIPGEPFCRLGKEIRKRSRPLIGLPVGCANGYLGYIAPPSAWKNEGYELSCGPWSKVDREAYGLILKTFDELKTRL